MSFFKITRHARESHAREEARKLSIKLDKAIHVIYRPERPLGTAWVVDENDILGRREQLVATYRNGEEVEQS